MQITIRTANPDTDYDRVAEIINTFDRQPITAREIREWDALTQPEGTRRRLVATAPDGQIVAYCGIVHDTWTPDGMFLIGLVVDLQMRGQGIGTQLYNEAVQIAQSRGAKQFSVEVLENDSHSIRFAEQRGYKLYHHVFESTLDLHSFHADKFAAEMEKVAAQGIRIFSLEEAPFNRDNLRKLWQVNHNTSLDDPASMGQFPDFEEFEKITTQEWFRAEGQILAADGDTYVGLSAVGHFKGNNSAYNMMTGVSRSHRGKGIAQALKLRSIQAAQNWGVDFIRTNNDSQNAPMLKINRKLGYEPQPGIYRMKKVLEG